MTKTSRRQTTWARVDRIVSLSEAHNVLPWLKPADDAEAAELREYYTKSAEVYRRVAEMDRGHHHEALYWAEREAQKAQELGGQ
ncbi:AMED_5909 family protein [Lentzea flava]|uniref:Uncharacterized protein n=1 Tax=Lentzea flava TaxID=103732 RepID=A0ABQ2UEL3_9PSEU|nr:AMED_5909 family protein [Lentzea flava]MCP2198498.1 hypothetical protein [Lentzea flava]GGU26291.1 hypothetical protein GCM10010178_18280 [Lentzea flava]